ncbi:hypothetical protein BEI46_18385 [Aliivibrio fischeri]|uniref:hypothetical protein n=1 Tax=Aliivibrio fischeri TaxID=668 RepID=UPI00084CC748|nr:hypothetical protein [Aliivibrio fischeri]OED52278.1 hypothetical protein BEI46_18385 [Aliivibrio fischeri]
MLNEYGYNPEHWNKAKSEAKLHLISVAKRKRTTSYSDLVSNIEAINFQPHDFELFTMLGELGTEESINGRGIITALVVHKNGDMQPGKGFYELATELSLDTTDQIAFWIAELNKVHNYWECR